MTVEEILQGESKDLEFKEKLPEDSKKYMKTIVAFSNGDGGRLIIGVNDDREVVGVEQTAVFSMIDKITNATNDKLIYNSFITNDINGCTLVANSCKKQKNRWNKHITTTTYSYKRKSILLDVDAFLEME
ncbi:helix-turn-helix domain-containing protein [Streptococcus equinus]|uniref:AlbA family DNA-binding domain-containing protein n=1 Tax=Streptococcus equinus TaxID=1335 RepID=UPI0008E42164|nr:ATP-binding protein [Streptococcus equinus]SFQ64377.1 Putative DNA-binding domain-containing protein [Streptococcus equinus]